MHFNDPDSTPLVNISHDAKILCMLLALYLISTCEVMPGCSGGDKLRLICMGKGMLSPDTKTLSAAGIPVFKTHPTPVNVAVRPENIDLVGKKGSQTKINPSAPVSGGSNASGARARGSEPATSGCSCVVS